MKKMELSIVVILLLVCIVAFSLPFVVTNATAQKLYSSDLIIPNTGRGSITPTLSTQRAMTIAAFAELFVTPTGTPAAINGTVTATTTSTFTSTF